MPDTTPLLTFDDATHTYRVGQMVLPSVTQVLAEAGLWTPVAAAFGADMEYARQLGTAVHEATQMDDEGDLDEETVAADVLPYLDAWRKFRTDMQPEVLAVEKRVWHPQYRYAGTIDRILKVNDYPTVVDIKTGAPHPATAVQTAAYRECLATPHRRASVHLTKEGTYKIEFYPSRTDFGVFLAALTVANWKREKAQ